MIPTIIKPTRITHSTATLIDNIYLKSNKPQNVHSGIILSDISDHFPIYMCYGINKSHTQPQKNKIKMRHLTPTKLQTIKQDLAKINWDNLYDMEINEAYNYFIKIIMETIDKTAPEKEQIIKNKLTFKEEWMSKGILKSSQTKEKLYKKALKVEKTDQIYMDYLKYRNLFNSTKRRAKEHYYAKLLELSKNDIKRTWNIMKMAMNTTNDKQS